MTLFSRARRGVLVPLALGLVASALTVVLAIARPRQALVGWIAAYGFAAATVVTGTALVMVLHVTGARWWLVLRRLFVAIVGTTPLLILLFVPIGAAFSLVYPWVTLPEDVSHHTKEALEHQRTWNNGGFFLARSALYLAVWTVFAVLLRRADATWRERPSAEITRRERTVSAIGIPVLGFTLSFASFDWLMALHPGWSSNIYGLYVITSGLVAALSIVAIGAWLARRSGMNPDIEPDHVHAVGRLMLMAVILWTYIGFFQFLLAWIADIPHEVTFYAARARGVWTAADYVLVIGRFVLPFLALLSRPLKRSPSALATVAVWLLATTVVDFAWLAVPSFDVGVTLANLLPFVAIGGLVWAYGAHLATHAPLAAPAPRTDPVVREALRYRSP